MIACRALGRALLLPLLVALSLAVPMPAPLLAQPGPPPSVDLPDPPDLGAVVVEDPLTTPALVPVGACPSGRLLAENVGEGYIIKIRGKCLPEDRGAEGFGLFRNLSVGDGEVAVEFKVAQGPARATIGLYVRAHERDALGITINPAEGAMSIFRRTNGQSARIATRRDLGDSVDPLDWNRFAIRTRGPETWLLLNEEPMLYTADAGVDDGGAYFVVIREGNPDDQEEVSVVFRNLTVSALADGDPTRAPALRPTPPRP